MRRLPPVVTITDVCSVAFLGGTLGFVVFSIPAYLFGLMVWLGDSGRGPDLSAPMFWLAGMFGAVVFSSAALGWALRDRRNRRDQ